MPWSASVCKSRETFPVACAGQRVGEHLATLNFGGNVFCLGHILPIIFVSFSKGVHIQFRIEARQMVLTEKGLSPRHEFSYP